MLLPLLKERTAHAHARTEAAVPLLRAGLTVHGYALHLERMYGFYAPLEPALRPQLEPLNLGDLRLKQPLLEADLRALGRTGAQLAALPRCSSVPRVDTSARAVGCLYVLEGSTLGGQLLTRELTKRLPEGTPLSFLNPYGPDTGRRWRAFREAAEAAVPEAAFEAAVAAALQTFTSLEAWLTQAPAHPAPP